MGLVLAVGVVAGCSSPPESIQSIPTPQCEQDGRQVANLPAGAVWVRLCDGSADPGLVRIQPPDRLTADVAGLVAAYERLPFPAANQACTAELSSAYVLQFGYADGSVVGIRGELYGCRTVGARLGSDVLLREFTDRLTKQRSTTPATGSTASPQPSPRCGWFGPRAWMPVRLDGAVSAYACVTPDPGAPTVRELLPDVQRSLIAEATAAAREQPWVPCAEPPGPVTIVFLNARGEPMSFQSQCGQFRHEADQGRGDRVTIVWAPSPSAQRMLGIGPR
jgi:hypothetical protein